MEKKKAVGLTFVLYFILIIIAVVIALVYINPIEPIEEPVINIEEKETVVETEPVIVVEEEKEEPIEYSKETNIIKNLRISCDAFSSDFDKDGRDDGIKYYIRFSNETKRAIPAEGEFKTEFFFALPDREDREQGGQLDYVQEGVIYGEPRWKYFDKDKGYVIELYWDDFGDSIKNIRTGALAREVILETTFTSKEGTTVKDMTGELDNHFCTISQNYLDFS